MRHTYPDEYFIYLYMDKVSFLNYEVTKLELLEESWEREREREKIDRNGTRNVQKKFQVKFYIIMLQKTNQRLLQWFSGNEYLQKLIFEITDRLIYKMIAD